MSGEDSFPGLQTLCPHWWREGGLGREGEWDSKGEGDLSTSQRPHIQIPSRGTLEFQHTNFGRDTNIP